MSSPAPILARVFRGACVESTHRGNVAVVDEGARILASAGNPTARIYLRSAAKPFQAMPLLAAGGERAFRLGSDEIALMCASHGGEPRHVRVAAGLLARGGFSVRDLACGAHLPMHEPSAARLIARGERASALHNNCSGKHAGLLLACRLLGLAPSGYCDPSHAIQKRILLCVADFCGIEPHRIGLAVDGCNVPVFRVSLAALAAGYARLLAKRTGTEAVSVWNARRRIVQSMAESPGMVGGLGRFTTELLVAGRGRWIGKEGAEGVYAIGLAARGDRKKAVGIAFKIEDGSARARDAVALAILDRVVRLPAAASRRLEIYRSPAVRNVAGREVGRIEAHVPLSLGSRRL